MSPDMAAFPDRETIADKLAALGEAEQGFLALLLQNPQQDENLLAGLDLCLHRAALPSHSPSFSSFSALRKRASAAHEAFRAGLTRSGGLERAFPPA